MIPALRRDAPVICLAAALVAYCALWLLAPRATFYPYFTESINVAISFTHGLPAIVLSVIGIGVFFAPTMAFMAVQFAVVFYFAKLKMNFWQSLGTLLGFVMVAVGLMALIVVRSGAIQALHHVPTIRQSLYVAGMDQSILKMPMVIVIMLAAASIGYLISLRVTDKNLLLPVVMFAACIDLWTVAWGPVSVMVKKAPEVVQVVSAPIPHAGAGVFIPKFLIGPGDFLFAGLVFAVVSRLKMNGPRTFWFVLGAMMLGMLGISMGLVSYFPALILLAVGVAAANWREFKLSRSEVISVAVVAVVLGATVPLVWSVLSHHPK